MRRLVRLFVVCVAAFVAAAPLAQCVIDEPMGASQMACCAERAHDCGSTTLTKDCCPPNGNSGRQLVPAATIQVHSAPLAPTSGPFGASGSATLHSAPLSAFESFDREILKLPERPTYLLVSAFLI